MLTPCSPVWPSFLPPRCRCCPLDVVVAMKSVVLKQALATKSVTLHLRLCLRWIHVAVVTPGKIDVSSCVLCPFAFETWSADICGGHVFQAAAITMVLRTLTIGFTCRAPTDSFISLVLGNARRHSKTRARRSRRLLRLCVYSEVHGMWAGCLSCSSRSQPFCYFVAWWRTIHFRQTRTPTRRSEMFIHLLHRRH